MYNQTQTRGGVSKVLLIEDNPGDVALLKYYVNEGGLEKVSLSHASTVAEAERFLSSQTFDSIVLDLRLPDAQGVESIERIRQLANDVPIIILSGTLDPTITPELAGAGVDSYHRKEAVSADSLVWSIKLAIDRSKGLMNSNDTGVDEETGLFSQFGFQNVAEEAFRTACASDSEFCVIWLSAEPVQNDVPIAESIKVIAKVIEASVRSSDFIARVESQSFLIALPGVGRKVGDQVCDRLVRKLRGCLHSELGLKIGTAFLEPTVPTLSTLIVSARSKAKPACLSDQLERSDP
jgi:DNA-binding response OmpR family regulator